MNRKIDIPYVEDAEMRRTLEKSMTGRLQYTLMNDFLAKYSLQNDLYALRGLLAALLRLELSEITDIEILNPVTPGKAITDKDCILDVRLELNHSRIINIEIQSRYQEFWPERSITYLCRNFDHLTEGQSYRDIKPCVQIGILRNGLFRKTDPRYTGEFYDEYELLSTSHHTRYSSKFAIKVLSLNHLEAAGENEKNDPNGLYFWAKLFRAKSWEELKMTAEDNPHMKSFIGTVRKMTAEEEILEACEARRRYSNEIATYEEEVKAAAAERDRMTEERDRMTEERDRVTEERDQLARERDRAMEDVRKMQAEIEALKRRLEK